MDSEYSGTWPLMRDLIGHQRSQDAEQYPAPKNHQPSHQAVVVEAGSDQDRGYRITQDTFYEIPMLMVALQMRCARSRRLAALESLFFRLAHKLWFASMEDGGAFNFPATVAEVD